MRGCVCNTLTILPNELTHTQTNTHFFIPYLKELWCQHKQSLNKASKHNFGLKLKVTFCDVYIDSYVHLLLYSPPLLFLLLLHLSPPSVHLLLSNCSRNLSFISITCRKPAEPKIAPVLQAFLYRPIFPVPFSLESLWPSPCLFLQCPSLISTSPQTQCQKQLLDLIVFLKVLVMNTAYVDESSHSGTLIHI